MSKKLSSNNSLLLCFLLSCCFILFSIQAGAATKMPQFNLPSAVNGTHIDSQSFAGKVVLITFFATWCPPCMEEIPTLINLQENYGAKGFSVVGLAVDQGGAKVVSRLINKAGINYPVLMADNKIGQDFGGILGIPVSFLINKKGNVVKNYPGYVPHRVLEKDIKTLLN